MQNHNTARILLVDDEPFSLKLLERVLGRLGVSHVVARDRAVDALALIDSGDEVFDLIFCDLQMPEMDGVEFLRHLAQIGCSSKVVLISGENNRILESAQAIAKARNLDVIGALHKPIHHGQIEHVLNTRVFSEFKGAQQIPRAYGPDELKRAIVNKELCNYYQPKVAVATAALAGVETLVRWQHPADGLIFPDQFIPTAEEHGLIGELTSEVLTSAFRQVGLWANQGLRLHVAVNVSMHNLVDLAFPDFVVRLAGEAGVRLADLVLEVTESRITADPLASLDILTRLRLKHIGLSIDDFGTGHSSLAQLRDIPFSELKIDKGFVHGAHRNESLRAIFAASLDMARQLGITAVAEGVEDRDDWEFLRRTGCDLAQGYFIAKPMPGAALSDWISTWEQKRIDVTQGLL